MNPSGKFDELKRLRQTFLKKMGVLRDKKNALFSLFRKRLEEEKIKEIRNNLTNVPVLTDIPDND